MAQKTAPLLPATRQRLTQLGERLKLARLRRQLTAKQVAERAGMSQMTLRSLEAGGSGVTIGAYLSVMQVLGLEHDIDKIAAADEAGRDLQDARLLGGPPRSARRQQAAYDVDTQPLPAEVAEPAPQPDLAAPPASSAVSSSALAGLIRPAGQRRRKEQDP